MSRYTLVVERLTLPAIVVHGGAGAYLKTTTVAQRLARGRALARIAREAAAHFQSGGGRAATLAAIAALEDDPTFNAGYGSRLQRDGRARMSAALMDGRTTRLSAVYNVQACARPSELCAALQSRPDRNLDGEGARALMAELGVAPSDVRTAQTVQRWQKLLETGDNADREAAIGSAGEEELDKARALRIPVPAELEAIDPEERHGTVGAVACGSDGGLWACTSTGGRGHEAVGRISDSPTPAGNYACPLVALSATGFGEQIIDLNLCGRIATRMLDGQSLGHALGQSFDEVADHGGLCGVIAIGSDGQAGYAHTTEACGVAWIDGRGAAHVDQHGR